MKNIELEISIHPFNEVVMNDLIAAVPSFAKIKANTKEEKIRIYNRIKDMNHKKGNRIYNQFFESYVQTLN